MGEDPGVAALGTYVAHDEGMFTKNGLDVKISSVTNITQIPAAVGHQFDFGTSVQPIMINAAIHGIPDVITAGGQVDSKAHPDSGLVVTKKSGIASAKDLEGKTVAVPTVNGNNALCVLNWAKEHGADWKSIHLVQVAFPNEAEQLKSGRVDAMYPVYPFVTAGMREADGVNLGDACLSISSHQGSFLISNKSWAQSHVNVIKAVQKSLVEASTWIQAHPSDARAILSKWTGLSKDVTASIPLQTYDAQDPVADITAWETVMKEFGVLTGTPPPASSIVFPVNVGS